MSCKKKLQAPKQELMLKILNFINNLSIFLPSIDSFTILKHYHPLVVKYNDKYEVNDHINFFSRWLLRQ
jgi:hypothetical protein